MLWCFSHLVEKCTRYAGLFPQDKMPDDVWARSTRYGEIMLLDEFYPNLCSGDEFFSDTFWLAELVLLSSSAKHYLVRITFREIQETFSYNKSTACNIFLYEVTIEWHSCFLQCCSHSRITKVFLSVCVSM